MNLFGHAVFAVGYAIFYYGLNILVQSYKRTGTMNPPPLSVVLGIPGSNAGGPSDQTDGPAGGPSPTVPGTTQPDVSGAPPISFGQDSGQQPDKTADGLNIMKG